jgi:hypothetical protein
MKMRGLIAALVLLLGLAGLPAHAQSPTRSFLVTGQVQMPQWVDVAALRHLPRVNQNVTYFAAGVVENETFTGALLWDLLQSVGIITNPAVKNDILHKTITVTGTDGYVAVFTAGEIDPGFGGNQILVAYLVNGQPLGAEGPAQIVAPGDKAGGRFVHNIATIIVEGEWKLLNRHPRAHSPRWRPHGGLRWWARHSGNRRNVGAFPDC